MPSSWRSKGKTKGSYCTSCRFDKWYGWGTPCRPSYSWYGTGNYWSALAIKQGTKPRLVVSFIIAWISHHSPVQFTTFFWEHWYVFWSILFYFQNNLVFSWSTFFCGAISFSENHILFLEHLIRSLSTLFLFILTKNILPKKKVLIEKNRMLLKRYVLHKNKSCPLFF